MVRHASRIDPGAPCPTPGLRGLNPLICIMNSGTVVIARSPSTLNCRRWWAWQVKRF